MTKPFLDVAIVGAGPYGLSVAAHLSARGVEHRVFGEPMGTWKANMPSGMLLKSYPWASNLSDPAEAFTVRRFCADRALPYHDEMMPLPLERFVEYGEAFRARHVPAVERRVLAALEPDGEGFVLAFSDGETVRARRVVLAVGLDAFRSLPDAAARLPRAVASHSADYGPLSPLDGKEVIVLGAGASATDLAALLHERRIEVSLVGRETGLSFAERPRGRAWFERIAAPAGGIGNGWTLGTCAEHPELIHLLPERARLRLAGAPALRPLGSSFTRARVEGRLPLHLGLSLRGAETRGGRVFLDLADADGRLRTMRADHVVFATGYRVDLDRLAFIKPAVAGRIRRIDGAPRLSRNYESSLPGLHFVGPAAANSFGPVSRFLYGTSHASRHLARFLAAALPRGPRLDGAVQPAQLSATVPSPALLPEKQSEVLS